MRATLRGAADVVFDLTVADVNHAMRMRGDVGFVGDEDDRVASPV